MSESTFGATGSVNPDPENDPGAGGGNVRPGVGVTTGGVPDQPANYKELYADNTNVPRRLGDAEDSDF